MKKRLLITSIVMMLVVAVALSTATYAWFTSNNSVTASSITMTATSSNTASLAIAWVPAGENPVPTYSSSIESDVVSTLFSPAAPTTITAATTLANFTFGSSTIKTINGLNYFNADGGEVVTASTSGNRAYLWTGLAGTSTTIRLKNMSSTQTSRAVWVTASISDNDENNANENGIGLIRVAVFQDGGLVGIMANTASTIAYGTIAGPSATPTAYETAEVKMHISGESAQGVNVVPTTATVAATGLNLGTIAAQSTTDIQVVVWMDGQALGDSQGGLAAKVDLTFTEVAA